VTTQILDCGASATDRAAVVLEAAQGCWPDDWLDPSIRAPSKLTPFPRHAAAELFRVAWSSMPEQTTALQAFLTLASESRASGAGLGLEQEKPHRFLPPP